MNKTSIEWTDFTWNPVTGCHKVSPGCKNCYAETLTNRFAKVWGVKSFRDVTLHENRLNEPIKNRKKWAGKKVFVCSMSDLFQEEVPFDFIVKVFQAIASCPETTFQILTKRPERCLEFYKWATPVLFLHNSRYEPVRNVWIGTSVENQELLNARLPYLLQIPAKVKFLSCEPLIGPIDFRNVFGFNRMLQYKCNWWVIVGGESGVNARPMHSNWVSSIRNQCAMSGIPFFFKQWGEFLPGVSAFEGDMTVCSKGPDCTIETGSCDGEIEYVQRVGKSKSSNLLNGVQHLNFPKV